MLLIKLDIPSFPSLPSAGKQPPHLSILFLILLLIHLPDDLGLLVRDLLIELGTPRGLISVHLCRQRGINLAGLRLLRLVLAGRVVVLRACLS